MRTTGSKYEESDTVTSTQIQEVVHSDIIDCKVRPQDTMSELPQKGQTVLSSAVEGNVWLSYIPRERKMGSNESDTRD